MSAIVIFHVRQVFSPQTSSRVRRILNQYCVPFFSMHSIPHFVPSFPVFVFWITGTRRAPPTAKEAYCISGRCKTYTLLWSRQHVEAVCSMQLLCQMSLSCHCLLVMGTEVLFTVLNLWNPFIKMICSKDSVTESFSALQLPELISSQTIRHSVH